MLRPVRVLWLVLVLSDCSAPSPAQKPPATPSEPVAPEVGQETPRAAFPLHSLGLSRIALLNYPYWNGRESFLEAESAAERQQWERAAALCREVLDVNPDHAGARYLLATALAMQGKSEGVAEQLSMALSDDWLRWGPGFEADSRFSRFRQSAEGKRFALLLERYRQQFAAIRARSVWVIGRRAAYEAPETDRGVRFDVSRAEVFLYDPLEGRFHRVTHTDESVLGFKPLENGDVVFVSNRASLPAVDHWQLRKPEIHFLDGNTLVPIGPPISFEGPVDRLALREGERLELMAWTRTGDREEALSYAIDRKTGTLTKIQSETEPATGDLVVSHWHPTLAPEPSPLRCSSEGCVRLDGVSVALPKRGSLTASYASPDGAWLAAVISDPDCGRRESTLVVVAMQGEPKVHEVHSGPNTFHRVRWLDSTRLLFEADREVVLEFRLDTMKSGFVVRNGPGIALNGLGQQQGPCDGRLEQRLAAVSGDWIRTLHNIKFAFDSAELLPESYALLNEVAAVLRRHPEITKVEIQGHADRHASPGYNLRLSGERAESVRHDLIMRGGIAEHRLVSKGYGQARPLDGSATEQADAKNRRVSFKILARDTPH